MASDSVPAPMVQIPAETVEKLREAYNHRTAFAANVIAAARALLDAAHPAASVPAADSERVTRLEAKIIAIANQRDDALAEVRRVTAAYDTICVSMERWKERAEQVDKGEAVDTPRDEEAIKCPTCGVARGWNEDGRLTRGIWTLNCVRCGSFQVEIEDAPAAPPEPVCRCGHAKSEHAQESFSCGHVIEGSGCELHVCSCSVFRYGSPARVPVNDEAEAAWQAWSRHWPYESTWPNERPPAHSVASRESFLAGFRAARGEDA